ncbi:MAG: DUF3344 domain-containing protein [Methanoregula sp.]|nr:DUF3344 domain-containing protein [Methanoregula sp.]
MRNTCHAIIILIVLASALLAYPAGALYDFEGLPLSVSSQGTVEGNVIAFGQYGLKNPPYELKFALPSAPRFARVYTGVWGGTEKYTGWADITINNKKKIRYLLNGDRDVSRELYESGHGIYWIAYDPTDLLTKGDNLITVTTSKGESGNKLDGRVYAIVVVAAVDDPAAGETQYWIAEGNENLHGEGWAGTNPTKHEDANVTFASAGLAGMTRANLSVLLLAGGKGQPDYVQFNGQYLGIPVRNASGQNVTDTGNEVSFDAEGGAGTPSRYTDMEVFNVTALVTETNTVRFIRGLDLDGDGTIATTGDAPEGEDYIHPVLAILTVTKPGTGTGTDFAVEGLRAGNAFAGENAVLEATIRSYGLPPAGPVPVTFAVDGKTINTTQVTVPRSGITVVQVPWVAVAGSHTITAGIAAPSDTRPGNNEASLALAAGTPPDLSVRIGSPFVKGSAPAAVTKSPLPACGACAAVGLLLVWYGRRRRPSPVQAGSLLLTLMLVIPAIAVPVSAETGAQEYTLPLQVTNSGGSDAPTFTVTVYLDGEKIADKRIDAGLAAGATTDIPVPVYVAPGSHEVKVVVDEEGAIVDSSRGNNLAQGRYDFPG